MGNIEGATKKEEPSFRTFRSIWHNFESFRMASVSLDESRLSKQFFKWHIGCDHTVTYSSASGEIITMHAYVIISTQSTTEKLMKCLHTYTMASLDNAKCFTFVLQMVLIASITFHIICSSKRNRYGISETMVKITRIHCTKWAVPIAEQTKTQFKEHAIKSYSSVDALQSSLFSWCVNNKQRIWLCAFLFEYPKTFGRSNFIECIRTRRWGNILRIWDAMKTHKRARVIYRGFRIHIACLFNGFEAIRQIPWMSDARKTIKRIVYIW